MTPFIMIGNRYIFDQGISETLPILEDNIYISVYFEKAFLFRDDILYLPCLIHSFNYHMYLTDYYNYNSFKTTYEKFKAELRSLYSCRIAQSNFMDFLNEKVLISFYKEYAEAILYLYDKHKDIKDYEYKAKAFILSEYIQSNKLTYENKSVKILFNPFTDYGRYGLNANSFNILSLSKEKRYKLTADKNFEFFEFDYNAFEIRILLALLKINQPAGDLYEVLHNMSDDYRQRAQFKQFLISSIYSKNEDKTVLFKFMKGRGFYERYKIIDGFVTNVFGKKMDSDPYHLLSRILQSSAAYVLYQQMYNLLCFIESNKLKSKISFCIHDSVCLSVHKDELEFVSQFKEILSLVKIKELDYESSFEMKTKRGTDYGEMKVYEA